MGNSYKHKCTTYEDYNAFDPLKTYLKKNRIENVHGGGETYGVTGKWVVIKSAGCYKEPRENIMSAKQDRKRDVIKVITINRMTFRFISLYATSSHFTSSKGWIKVNSKWVGCYERSVWRRVLASYTDVSFLIPRSGEVDRWGPPRESASLLDGNQILIIAPHRDLPLNLLLIYWNAFHILTSLFSLR